MILPIQTGQGNPVLRKESAEVGKINADLKQLILDMTETMEVKDGLGLAAPQINRSLQIIVVKPAPDQESLVLINPQIKSRSARQSTMEEGCLSLPGIYLPIKRSVKITVKALDAEGKTIKIRARDLLARVIQHEVDHLHGILITDYHH
jgi:peptide deformylase